MFKRKEKGLLEQIAPLVDKAIADGTTLKQFKDEAVPILQKHGWSGPFYERWLEQFYNVNLRSLYAARKWNDIQRTKKTRPYIRRIGLMDNDTSPECSALNDVIRPVDDPFWEKFYPMGNCRCSVQQLSERDLKRLGLSVTKDEDLPSF